MRWVLACALVLCGAVPALAQTPVQAGHAYTVQGLEHSGANTDRFELRIDNTTVQQVPVSALVAGTVTFPNKVTFTAGLHQVAVCAVNSGGDGCAYVEVEASSGQPPPPPPPTGFPRPPGKPVLL